VNEANRTVAYPVANGTDLSDGFWANGDFAGIEDRPLIDPMAGLATLGFLKAALGRQRKLWATLALVGLATGSALYLHLPPSYQAGTQVLLADGPNENPQVQINSDAALAQSSVVGKMAMTSLALSGSVTTFLGSYTVTPQSDLVLSIVAKAPTSAEAVQHASAIATAFLQVRAQYARIQQQQAEASFNQQVAAARDQITSLDQEISTVQGEPISTDQQAKLDGLKQQRNAALAALSEAQQGVTATIVTTRTQTAAEIQNSQVIDEAAPLKHSKIKNLLYYILGGLIGGLVLGVGIVIIGALLSDRIRRRDDVAYAISARVGLSVGPLRAKRWSLPLGSKDTEIRARDMRRVVEYLRLALGTGGKGSHALAVVAVDDSQTAANAVVSLATRTASQGKRVLLADLSSGHHAGQLLGKTEPGVHVVDSEGSRLIVVIPALDDIAPMGPVPSRDGNRWAGNSELSNQLASAARSADELISLVSLDPEIGGDHLATWATSAVAMVTTGKSTATTIRSVGEMVRLAGLRMDSVVLLGADRHDESLGAWSTL